MDSSEFETALRNGIESGRRRQFAQAEKSLLRALELKHDCTDAQLALARVYAAQSRWEDAIDYLELAVHFEPKAAGAWVELGVALNMLGRADAARAALSEATHLEPRNAAAWIALGGVHKAAEAWPQATECYRHAVSAAPDSADALCLLGYALYQAGNYDEARRQLEAAVALAPALLAAHHNLGLVHLETGAASAALACFEKALAIDPGKIETRACRAHALRDLNRLDEAIAGYDSVLADDPQFADAVINRSYALLMRGDLREGWKAYDARFTAAGQVGRNFAYPEWRGEPLAGKRLLVYAEQGLGDEIMFASCLPDVLAQAANCIVECNTRLARLFRRSFPSAQVHGGEKRDDPAWLAECATPDYQIAIGSLPCYLRLSADAFPLRDAYLKADAARSEHWRARWGGKNLLRVGIAWRGGTLRSRQFARSIPLRNWLPVLRTQGAAFYSLQYGNVAGEIDEAMRIGGVQVDQPGAASKDLDELAAIIASLDLVITVDNTVAHLAGALGCPVWTLLPAAPEWRYPRNGARMPWYSSMRLFHRSFEEDAAAIMGRVASGLAQRIESRTFA